MRDYEAFLVERRDDGVALITIDRADKQNAMSVAFFRELPLVLADLDADEDVGVAVITGAGNEAFSAGGDIASFAELASIAEYRRRLRLVYDAFHSVECAEIPVLGAVNGLAYGGGLELTLACDLAIASERARFAFREPTVGLMPGYGVVRGPEVIGPVWTRYLALTADPIDAQQAERIGLVIRVVSHDELIDQTVQLARRILSRAPLATRLAKQFVNRRQMAPGQAESVEATSLLFASSDHTEGVRAFLGKRAPHFEGR